MIIFLVEIDGRPVAAIGAGTMVEAEKHVKSLGFRTTLMTLQRDGSPLWDGTSEIHVRQPTSTEEAKWGALFASGNDEEEIRCIVPIDRPSLSGNSKRSSRSVFGLGLARMNIPLSWRHIFGQILKRKRDHWYPSGTVYSRTLCYDGDYSIEMEHEEVYLRWPGGVYPIGDHYGNPTCGAINALRGWCVTGGEGLVVALFEGGFPPGEERVNPLTLRKSEIWRRDNPPPDRTHWWVSAVWQSSGDESDLVRVAIDRSGYVDAYELNVRTLEWHSLVSS